MRATNRCCWTLPRDRMQAFLTSTHLGIAMEFARCVFVAVRFCIPHDACLVAVLNAQKAARCSSACHASQRCRRHYRRAAPLLAPPGRSAVVIRALAFAPTAFTRKPCLCLPVAPHSCSGGALFDLASRWLKAADATQCTHKFSLSNCPSCPCAPCTCSGGDLFDLVSRYKRLTEDEARVCFQQLVCGAAWCHSQV